MQITTQSFIEGQAIPEEFAFARQNPTEHISLSDNKNPAFEWRDLPDGTKSLVLICHDHDVPTKPDDVNKEDRQVPADLPRADFFHWVLVDLSPEPASIAAGEFSQGVTAGGKDGPNAPRNSRQGINNYREWFQGDTEMAGNYYGYDGPCPPWNDSIVHHYTFTLYALDVARCPVEGDFTGPEVLSAIDGHILEKAEIMGTYSLNPAVSA